MNTNQYTQKTLEALQSAQTIAAAHQNQQIEQAHLLLALLQQDGGLIPQLLKKMGVSVESLTAAAQAAVEKLRDGRQRFRPGCRQILYFPRHGQPDG